MKKGYRMEHPLFVAAGLQFDAYTLVIFLGTDLSSTIQVFHNLYIKGL